ncbi:hypothetical protein CN918_28965 [Priestia megaterium]|nr:hypothetical protein CN918_28965 [Priestia megaterium]
MKTKEQFMEEEKKAIGEQDFKHMYGALDNEYYEMVEKHIKQDGNTITQEVFEGLSKGQQFHFNKHYNFRQDKVK